MSERTPEEVIVTAITMSIVNYPGNSFAVVPRRAADMITRALTENGFDIVDTLAPVKGEDITAGAGPDEHCGCGEPITMYDGVWLHIYNPELRGTDDHDAEP